MPSALRHALDLLAGIAWLTFASFLLIAMAALLPFLMVAYLCDQISNLVGD